MATQSSPPTPEMIKQVEPLLRAGKTYKEIAQLTDVSVGRIGQIKKLLFGNTPRHSTDGTCAFKFDKPEGYCYDEADDCKHYCRHKCKFTTETVFVDDEGQRDVCPYYDPKPDKPEPKDFKNGAAHSAMVELYNEGLTYKQIAQALDLSTYTVCNVLKDLRADGVIQNRQCTNLTEDESKQIIKLYKRGWTYAKIAEKTGLTPARVKGHVAYKISKGELKSNKERIKTWNQ